MNKVDEFGSKVTERRCGEYVVYAQWWVGDGMNDERLRCYVAMVKRDDRDERVKNKDS